MQKGVLYGVGTGPGDPGLVTRRAWQLICDAKTVAIMKLGRHMPRLRALLTDLGLAESTLYVSHASLERQFSCALHEAPDDAPYFSMLLLYKGQDPWIRT